MPETLKPSPEELINKPDTAEKVEAGKEVERSDALGPDEAAELIQKELGVEAEGKPVVEVAGEIEKKIKNDKTFLEKIRTSKKLRTAIKTLAVWAFISFGPIAKSFAQTTEGDKIELRETEEDFESKVERIQAEYKSKIADFRLRAKKARQFGSFSEEQENMFLKEFDPLKQYCQEKNATDSFEGILKVMWDKYFGEDQKYLELEEGMGESLKEKRKNWQYSESELETMAAKETAEQEGYDETVLWDKYFKAEGAEQDSVLIDIAKVNLRNKKITKDLLLEHRRYKADFNFESTNLGRLISYSIEALVDDNNQKVSVTVEYGGKKVTSEISINDL